MGAKKKIQGAERPGYEASTTIPPPDKTPFDNVSATNDTSQLVMVVWTIFYILYLFSPQLLMHSHKPSTVASLTTSLSKLFLGTYEGAIYCIDINALLQDNGDHHSLSVPQNRSQVLQGHYRSVYSMFCLEGYIDISGTTSFFPTFVGQAMKSTSQEFLVSIGYGRGFPEVKGIFKTSSQRHGTYLNTWIV